MLKILFIALLSVIIANAETIQTKSTEMISSPTGTFIDNNKTSNEVNVIFYRLNGDKNDVAKL